jgi:hypothetical protein
LRRRARCEARWSRLKHSPFPGGLCSAGSSVVYRRGGPARSCYFALEVGSKNHATRLRARAPDVLASAVRLRQCCAALRRPVSRLPAVLHSGWLPTSKIVLGTEASALQGPLQGSEESWPSTLNRGGREYGHAKKSPASAPGSSHESRPSMGGLTASTSHPNSLPPRGSASSATWRKEARSVPTHR